MCSQQLAGSTSVNSKQRIVTLPVVGRDDKKPLQQHVHLYVSPNCLGHERIKQGFHVASRAIVVSTSPTDAAAAVAFILYLAKGSLDEQKYQAEIAAMIQDGRPYILVSGLLIDSMDVLRLQQVIQIYTNTNTDYCLVAFCTWIPPTSSTRCRRNSSSVSIRSSSIRSANGCTRRASSSKLRSAGMVTMWICVRSAQSKQHLGSKTSPDERQSLSINY
jgi:hypothetical protein